MDQKQRTLLNDSLSSGQSQQPEVRPLVQLHWAQRLTWFIPFLSYSKGQELYTRPGCRRRTKFYSENKVFIFLLLLAFLAIMFAVVEGFSNIGRKIVSKYSTEIPSDFEQSILLNTTDLQQSIGLTIPSIKSFDDRNKDLIKALGLPDPENDAAYFALLTVGSSLQVLLAETADGQECNIPIDAIGSLYEAEGQPTSYGFGFIPRAWWENPTEEEFPLKTSKKYILKLGTEQPCSPNTTFVAGDKSFYQAVPAVMTLSFGPLLADAVLEQVNLFTPFTMTSGGVEEMTFVPQPGGDLTANQTFDVFYTLTHQVVKGMYNPQEGASLWKRTWAYLSVLNPFSMPFVTYNIPKYAKSLNTTEMNNGKILFDYQQLPLKFNSTINLVFQYPPTSSETIEYMTVNRFFVDIGGYLSLIKSAVGIVTGLFIFKELNQSMARRILDREPFEGSKEEKDERLQKLASEFRERVSQEGIYDLHDLVLKQSRRIQQLEEENSALASRLDRLEEKLKDQKA